jgi:hypothetical protein
MSRGVILFAFNSPKYNYYEMAEHTAKRVRHFLNLPVTIVTDKASLPKDVEDDIWDKIIKVVPDKNNFRDWGMWINKGRYMAYDLSPYDETILLDVDYVVNSTKLLTLFDIDTEFCCHDRTSFLMHPKASQELLSAYSYETLWATVIMFRKSDRAEQIFKCLEMVQKNYEHYANIHNFIAGVYRNDYALTLALRIADGHYSNPSNFIPWDLLHVGKNTQVYPDGDTEFNTKYTIMFDNWQRGKIRKEYINIKDMDFHLMNKDLFEGIIHNG